MSGSSSSTARITSPSALTSKSLQTFIREVKMNGYAYCILKHIYETHFSKILC